MPEIPDSQTVELAQNLRQAQAETEIQHHEWLTDAQIASIVEEANMGFIAAGAECAVIEPLNHSPEQNDQSSQKNLRGDIVVAIDYKRITDPKEAKEIFYTQRIMSTLFPHNFPRFFASYGGTTEKQLSGTIRQRIDDKNLRFSVKEFKYNVEDLAKQLGMPVKFDYVTPKSFIATEDGVYYLDKVKLRKNKEGSMDKLWNKQAIEEYMTRQGFNDTQKLIVEKSINRLEQLNS